MAARESGATAGVTRQGSQPVFASSRAPAKSHAKARKAHHAAAKANTAPATATRSATGDLWSGVRSAAGSPLAAAEASAGGQAAGTSSSVVVGIAILGLGLAGLAGGFLVTAGRRRKSGSTIGKINK